MTRVELNGEPAVTLADGVLVYEGIHQLVCMWIGLGHVITIDGSGELHITPPIPEDAYEHLSLNLHDVDAVLRTCGALADGRDGFGL